MTKYLFVKTSIHLLSAFLIICQTRKVEGIENNDAIMRNLNFIVNLCVDGEVKCRGSLVTPRIVVTAAHCIENLQSSQLTVMGAVPSPSDYRIITPKNYIDDLFSYTDTDIAVLKLSDNMNGDIIATPELCKTDWKLGDFIDVYVWEVLNENNDGDSNQLRKVRVPLVTGKRCSDMYKVDDSIITKTLFCAGDFKEKDDFVGESGGPNILPSKIVGVVSWGNGCARTNYPGIFTNNKTVRNFIDQVKDI